MKQLFALLVLALAVGAMPGWAQSVDDQYVGIYNLIQQGDGLAETQPAEALAKYLAAQTSLQRLQSLNPGWNPKVVNFRLTYLADKIAELPGAKPKPAAPVSTTTPPTVNKGAGSTPARATETKPTPESEAEQQIRGLQDTVRRLQADKTILEAKVREAFATQPAAIDPRELVKAQEKIQSLLKENELLKATAGPEPVKLTPAADTKELDETQRALADANRKLTEQAARASSLGTEKEALQKQLALLTAATEGTNNPARLRQALQEANRTVAEQTVAARQLAAEREALRERLNKLSASAAAAEGLRAENELLKKQLAQLQREPPPASLVQENQQRTTEAEARVAALQSDAEVLRLEKRALETRLQKATAVPVTVPDRRAEDRQRIKQLEAERDEAQQKLAAVSQLPQPGSNQELAAKVEQLTQEIAGLRARLIVFEARTLPYSVEELALFKPSAPKLITADSGGGRKPVPPLPRGTTALAAEAQRHFAARQYDQAEAKYQDLLQQDEKNSTTLANLARVQIENDRFDEAEKNIRLALTSAPDDGDNLFVLGYLKLQQKKYDEALDPLSRAVQINPNRAELQNCLGVTLSHQGLRGPAETAFRKAIQIDPTDANAHNNLAVMYAEQTPPLMELARWHYQKALAAGQPKNPDLEQVLERKAVTPLK